MKRPLHVKVRVTMRVEMWESVLWISTFPHAVIVEAIDAVTWGHGPKPGGLLFAFDGDRSGSPRSMSFASGGRRHLCDDRLSDQHAERAYPPVSWLRHPCGARLGGR